MEDVAVTIDRQGLLSDDAAVKRSTHRDDHPLVIAKADLEIREEFARLVAVRGDGRIEKPVRFRRPREVGPQCAAHRQP